MKFYVDTHLIKLNIFGRVLLTTTHKQRILNKILGLRGIKNFEKDSNVATILQTRAFLNNAKSPLTPFKFENFTKNVRRNIRIEIYTFNSVGIHNPKISEIGPIERFLKRGEQYPSPLQKSTPEE